MKPPELFLRLDAKRVAIGAALVIALLVAGRCGLSSLFTSGEAHSAQERVRRVLDGMKEGGNIDQAIALWYQGTLTLPGGMIQFDMAATSFQAWRQEREIDRVGTYEIREARVTSETGRLGEATVIVSGTIDGQPFSLRAVDGQPLAWVP